MFSAFLSCQARSKNTRFLRHGSNNVSQEGKSTVDNMVHYGLQDRLIALVGVDAAVWAVPIDASPVSSSPSDGAGAASSSSSSPLPSLSASFPPTTMSPSAGDSSERRIGWNEDLDQYGLVSALGPVAHCISLVPPLFFKAPSIFTDPESILCHLACPLTHITLTPHPLSLPV